VAYDLSPHEVRVLGALLEKDLATPEYYPLSLNALTNACNQKTNRDPVTSYDDNTVRAALEALRERRLAAFVTEAGARVEKYRHRISEQLNFTRGELAILTVLLLRGPQTLGELRERSSRMHPFEDLQAVESVLSKLAEREPEPLVLHLPRVAGAKEARWAHLLSGEPRMEGDSVPSVLLASPPAADPALVARIEQLEALVQMVQEDLHELRQAIDQLRRDRL
jgi:uncharacterized protein YceH (UPF0502 family)